MTANTSGRSDLCQFRHIHRFSNADNFLSAGVPVVGPRECRKETPWNAQLSNEEVTVIGYALLLVTGNDAITNDHCLLAA
jgi:hypothetical protein